MKTVQVLLFIGVFLAWWGDVSIASFLGEHAQPRRGGGGGGGARQVDSDADDDDDDDDDDWSQWIKNFGHDVYVYPDWVLQQRSSCQCKVELQSAQCNRLNEFKKWEEVSIIQSHSKKGPYPHLDYCTAKLWLLNHMPEFDKYFLPPSVSVLGDSMFDDAIAFAVMADMAAPWATNIPLSVRLGYILPYATFHESRVNWRPLLFSKFFQLVSTSTSTVAAMKKLVNPFWPNNPYTNWSNVWPDSPKQPNFFLQWASSTSPPVTSPFDFGAYSYGSCTAWSTLVTYVARSVGIPTRQVGTPCWNGGIFRGLAIDNSNVSLCWQGGNGLNVGGSYLFNHNWVEYWDDVNEKWVFLNVPTETDIPNAGLCNFDEETGCDYSPVTGCRDASLPGLASRDHEILSVTWHFPGEAPEVDGGEVILVSDLKLSSGEPVSPLVWSPHLKSPLGVALKDVSLRVVNRTNFYACKPPK